MPRSSDHASERRRVADRLEDHVLAYLATVGVGGRFHGRQLVSWCMARVACSPSSPDRILRVLATAEPVRCEYVVISRRESLYELRAIWPEGKPVEGEAEQLGLWGL